MINMLLGLPGGGKSYEAVVFHILPALQAGRKVITNLALNLQAIGAMFPEYVPLIEIRTKTIKPRPEVDWQKAETMFKSFGIATREPRHNDFPFSNLEDYGDPWRHPLNGAGPLYVIDECHIALPRTGTPIKVEEWFSMHRHELADVLLITQTYGKVNQAIRDLSQVVYRVKKATAFGSDTKYIRKVQDGLRGEVVNTSIREYKPQYFKLYRSHTKSGAGTELASEDIRPIWKNWTFLGAGTCGVLLLLMGSTLNFKHPFKPDLKAPPKTMASVTDSAQPAAARPIETPTAAQVSTSADTEPFNDDPFKTKGLHIVGHMEAQRDGKPFERWMFAVSQNGQFVTTISHVDLEGSGYRWLPHSPCSGVLVIGSQRRPVSCDAPQIQLVPPTPGQASES